MSIKYLIAALILGAGSAHAVGNNALMVHGQMIKEAQKMILFSDKSTDKEKDDSAIKGHELARQLALMIDRQAADAVSIKEDCSAFGESIKAQVEAGFINPEMGTTELYKRSASRFAVLAQSYGVESCKELNQE